jgi:hypothetical protein
MNKCANCFSNVEGGCIRDGAFSEYPSAGVCDRWGTNDVYKINGFDDRFEYLESLADEYDCPLEIVYGLADMLGPDEDFDALVSSLQDWEATQC